MARRRKSKKSRRKNAMRRSYPKRSSMRSFGLLPKRRNAGRKGLSGSQLAAYRKAISRYGARRNPISRLKSKLLRNPIVGIAKGVGMTALRAGAGFVSSHLAGQLASSMVASPYAPVVANLAVVIGSELLQDKVPAAKALGHEFTAGASASLAQGIMNILVDKGIIPASIAGYLAPWREAPMVIEVPVAVDAAGTPVATGTGAYIQQASMYGMGQSSPIGSAMRHRLNMLESGMSGGIFDSKTTLGEYDLLPSAPPGTAVRAGLAEYVTTPMGAMVEQATAGYGMGATVEEAFAGSRGLREYVSTPLSGLRGGLRDYVNLGDQPQAWWQDTAQGSAIMGEIRNATTQLVQQRMASGRPVDQKFRQNLIAAARDAVKGQERDVSMAAPVAPLTREAAPFPGAQVGEMFDGGGIPASIPSASEAMDDADGGIFG